jgi:hypothetical protein
LARTANATWRIQRRILGSVNAELFVQGRDFIHREARLLERRLFAAVFGDGPPEAVVDCVRGYRNPDGGFGHALEPDKRAPSSQPLDVEVALEALDDADVFDGDLAVDACGFLETVADERGAVPSLLPSAAAYPRAAHWQDATPAGPVPTVGIAALLWKHEVQHPWRERVTSYCWSVVEEQLPDEAHALRECFAFLEHAPDRVRADAATPKLAAALSRARWFRAEADQEGYGLTPLHFAPTPRSRWRALFGDEQIDAHLDRLAAEQSIDGGWPITWEPPSMASHIEWRGIETLRALRVLVAYGRTLA